MTIEQFYELPNSDGVVLINEHDTVVQNYAFMAVGSGITGLWSFKNRQVIFFSATSNTSIEKIINDNLSKPTVLSFQSEYEMVHKVSAVSQGEIKPCKTKSNQLKELE